MLDGLLGRNGFSSKCKSLIKPTRTRIAVLRRREEAKQRFLKEDLAKLLANGLDVNAYGRTEEFIAGLNLFSCYTFIDQSCEYILKQLSVMQKLGQCPEECRETVASLMFAAARFSDLPELRDLRDSFKERYGNGLECYVNQVFVEKLASKPPVVEKRIKLLQDIAAEFLIQWDAKGFKQRMDKPSALPQKLGSLIVTDDEYNPPNGNNVFRKHEQRSKERVEQGPTLHDDEIVNIRRKDVLDGPVFKRDEHRKERIEHHDDTNVYGKRKDVLDGPVFKRDEHRIERIEHHDDKNVYGKRKDVLDGPVFKIDEHRKETIENHDDTNVYGKRKGVLDGPVSRRDEHRKERIQHHDDTIVYGKRRDVLDGPVSRRDEHHKEKIEHHNDGNVYGRWKEAPETNKKHMSKTENGENSMGKVKEGKTDYLLNGKSSDKEDGQKSTGRVKEEDQVRAKSAYNSPLPLPPPYVKLNIPPPYSKPLNASAAEKMKKQAEDLNDIIPLPKPKSVRRKHSKSASFSHDDDIGSSQDVHIVKRISSSRRKDRKGLQILFDDEQYEYHGHSLSRGHQDKEEKMMDKLLLHYSKKPSAYDIRKLRRKKTQPDTNPSSSKSPSPHHNGVEITVPPTRSISLPHEQSGESEGKKVYARANSFQPDNQAKHVHPKLPDYDDLAARFTALRGR